MSDYNGLSRTEKLRRAYAQLAESPLACEICGARIAVGQLADHVATRCPGPPHVTKVSRWATRREIRQRGIPDYVVTRWVKSGRLRFAGDPGARRYLLRDVDLLIAQRERKQAAKPAPNPAGKRKGKPLTKPRGPRQLRRMVEHLPAATVRRLRSFTARMGSIAAAGRELKIPADTLGRALRGENIRRGTRVLIEAQLDSLAKGDA